LNQQLQTLGELTAELSPRMNKGGLFVAHNVVNKKSEMGDFLDAIWKTPALYTTIVSPSSEGMSVSVKR